MEGEGGWRWGQNVRAMQVRIKSRFRVAMTSRRRKNSRRLAAATATGIVVARVFQGNVIFARMARNLAKQEWQKRVGSAAGASSRVWSWFGYSASAAGGAVAVIAAQEAPPAQAEALVVADVGASVAEDIAAAKKRAKQSKLSYYEEKAIAQAMDDSLTSQLAQAVMLPTVAGACHVFMHGLNVTEVYGIEKLEEAITRRPEGQSLITVCNHVAAMDDPLVMAALLPPSLFLHPKSLRWTLCATDRCFTNAAFSAFFRSVKVLPLKRGAGLQQEGIDIALSKLRRGDWVHIFPEGSRSRDGGKTIGTVRRGIGRLVTDVETTPLVVPFVHSGMQDLMPVGSKFPKVQKKVSVLVGDPIELNDLNAAEFASKAELYDAIAVRVGQRMQVMKEELDHLVAARELQLAAEEAQRLHSVEKAQRLLQYVDWEAQGLLPESDSLASKDHYLDLTLMRNSDAFAQICGTQEQRSREEQSVVPEQRISEAEMEEFFELEDDWDPLLRPSILSRVRGFVDTPTFLGLGFAARGLLSTRKEEEGSSQLNSWRSWKWQTTSKPLN